METTNKKTNKDKNNSKTQTQQTDKYEWVRHYAHKMYTLWQQRQIQLGVAQGYIQQIERDLSQLYEHPLKRMLVEMTY